ARGAPAAADGRCRCGRRRGRARLRRDGARRRSQRLSLRLMAEGGAGAGARRNTLALLLLVTAATSFLGWLFKGHCAFDGDWGNLEMYVTGCYSDAYPFWHARGLADGAVPYFEAPMEYPVLAGLLIWLEALW